MTKKIFLLLFTVLLLSIIFISCKKFDTTATTVSNQGAYTSIDPILGQEYKLKVTTTASTIAIAIVSYANNIESALGEAETIDKLYQETGSTNNYSFQNGVMSGNFSILSTDQIKISFVRNTPPYLSVRDVICTANNP